MGTRPPTLEEGVYGFFAEALNPSCEVYAAGCVEVSLPSDDAVTVTLSQLASVRTACSPDRCNDGRCESELPPDATVDAVVDAMMDACPSTESNCADRVDDDCDGMTDCADTDCGSSPDCEACRMITCPDCMICREGACVAAPDGEACPAGACAGGACCAGCRDDSGCQSGTDRAVCGNAGAMCVECGECQSCTGGACVAVADGTTCPGGLCAGGSCCQGCVQAGACVPGDAVTACGRDGGACAECGECQVCNNGTCEAAPDGASCPSGRCRGGSCCSGCWNGSSCEPGSAVSACGSGGNTCDTCNVGCQACNGTMCVDNPDGSSCLAGTCRGSPRACCQGCWDGSTCQSGQTRTSCGTGGMPCESCNSGDVCCPLGVSICAPVDACLR